MNRANNIAYSILRRYWPNLRFFALKNENYFIANLLTRLILLVSRFTKSGNFPVEVREFLSDVHPTNPLKSRNAPAINIVIPCHPKDFSNLGIVIEAARLNVLNPIQAFYLVTLDDVVEDLQMLFPLCIVEGESSYLTPDLHAFLEFEVPSERRGWIIQQIIKIKAASQSIATATLLLDSDTILLKPKTWLDANGVQILCIAYEYHVPYKEHQVRYFGNRSLPISFVTHHQLMQKSSVLSIFGEKSENLLTWLRSGDFTQPSAISEYDSYGHWFYLNRNQSLKFSRWGNSPINLAHLDYADYHELASIFSGFDSISAHAYLK